MKILTAAQMQEVDRLTSETCSVPGIVLMENAGINLFAALYGYFPELEELAVAVVCGKGNNGGDGLVLARQLVQRRIHPHVYLVGEPEQVSGDARINLEAYRQSGGAEIVTIDDGNWQQQIDRFQIYDVIVDALLGTGISKPVTGTYAEVVSAINSSEAFVLSVDIPSGMFSDRMERSGESVQADATVTFTAPKVAHLLHEDQEAIGELHVVSIGSPARLVEECGSHLNLMTRREIRSLLLPRPRAAHKGGFGHAVIAAGGPGKAGAAALCGQAALRSGAGLVTVSTSAPLRDLAASFAAEVMTLGLPASGTGAVGAEAAQSLLDFLGDKQALGLGPGLGREEGTVAFIHSLVAGSPVPLVVDADGINAFEGCADRLSERDQASLVLTPHPGEFARLLGRPTREVLADRVALARQFAVRHEVWLVLKGFRTLVADPEGEVWVCPLGNPGMATAGMGDVLTGLLTGLAAQAVAGGQTGMGSAARLGVYLHALAGDLAAQACGQQALTAGDVSAHIAAAFRDLDGEESAVESIHLDFQSDF